MSAYTFDLVATPDADVVVVTLTGELDLTNARELEERLEGAAPPDMLLVVDLSRVVFIDSAALHVFFKIARRRGPDALAVAMGAEAPIARAVDIVGLGKAMRIVPAPENAHLAPMD
ncbi:MAG TPA: STAS domain-containing protein [Gaiellaceae bacterium]|nr:STAS domain-containing protein [Gaiellaceae bacterium]